MKKTVLILVAVAGVFGAFVLYQIAQGFMDAARHGGSPAARERRLAEISMQINKELPKEVSPETVMVATKSGPGLRFTYVIQVVRRSKAEIDAAKYAAGLKPLAIEKYKNMPDFRKWEVELCYQYLDKDGNEITTVTASPKDL
jgi:hypothetical protein